MPDYKLLKVGDRIRLLAVPTHDLQQREKEIAECVEDAGITANTIERIITLDPVVTICEIDEWNFPWYEYTFPSSEPDAEPEVHSIAILDDESWTWA